MYPYTLNNELCIMAIVALQQVVLFNPNTVEEQIGSALCLRSMQHFIQYLGQPAIGFSYNSCNAAVAIQAHAQYDQISLNGGAQLFSVVYGTSRLFSGLDPDFNLVHANIAPNRPFSSSILEEHAEQTAIRVVDANPLLNFWQYNGNCHIYIDLTPCNNCAPWLQLRPENWYVHYLAQLNNQIVAVKHKRQFRSKTFGRQMEPPLKKRKLI